MKEISGMTTSPIGDHFQISKPISTKVQSQELSRIEAKEQENEKEISEKLDSWKDRIKK